MAPWPSSFLMAQVGLNGHNVTAPHLCGATTGLAIWPGFAPISVHDPGGEVKFVVPNTEYVNPTVVGKLRLNVPVEGIAIAVMAGYAKTANEAIELVTDPYAFVTTTW